MALGGRIPPARPLRWSIVALRALDTEGEISPRKYVEAIPSELLSSSGYHTVNVMRCIGSIWLLHWLELIQAMHNLRRKRCLALQVAELSSYFELVWVMVC